MKLNWKELEQKSANPMLVSLADCPATADEEIRQALGQTMDRAVSLLSDNVKDESRYFLFEWDASAATLTIVVTDDQKQNDAANIVKLTLSGLVECLHSDGAMTEAAHRDNIKYFVRDYLTTSSEFHRYSLIAIFHSASRDNTELL